MKTSIVLGLGFGDEGKGRVTSYLCSLTYHPLVIRFNGGHQAGHTVVHDGERHVFSSFGSGTLQGIPTYMSKYCTFFPTAVRNEYQILKQHNPILFVDPLCPVTTPYDMYHNRGREGFVKHGSCGVGFGSTIERNERYVKLFFQDLFYPSVLKEKMKNIAAYYGNIVGLSHPDMESYIQLFMEDIECAKDIVQPHFGFNNKIDHVIFEGAQGILLDMDFGFFPNVTRSNTTCKNALEIIKQFGITTPPSIYYVSRSYQTRHGIGLMSNEDKPVTLINNKNETNKTNDWQGEFRTGVLDVDMINYALACDNNFSKGINKNLVITCLDQTGSEFNFTINEKLISGTSRGLVQNIATPFHNIYESHSETGELESIPDSVLAD